MIVDRADRDYFNRRFGLNVSPETQDWEVEAGDPTRLDEFLSVLKEERFDSESKRAALIGLLVSSYNDYLHKNSRNLKLEKELARVVIDRLALLQELCGYWNVGVVEADAYPIAEVLLSLRNAQA